jgi:hypothetical protein
LGVGVALAFRGVVQDYWACDRYYDLAIFRGEPVYGQLADKYASSVLPVDILDESGLPKLDRFKYLAPLAIEDAIPVVPKQYFDLVLCYDVLEHVYDPSQAYRPMSVCMRNGGVMVHHVSPMTHKKDRGADSELDRLAQFRYSPFLWKMMYSNRGGTNRVLPAEHCSAKVSSGFRVLKLEISRFDQRLVEGNRHKLHPLFKKIPASELSCSHFVVIACKERELD